LIELDRGYRTARGEAPRPEDYRGLCHEYDVQLSGERTQLAAIADGGGPARSRPELPGLRIVEVLGAGGMGVVYKAWQPSLDRYVAVKMLRNPALAEADHRERFTREARAVAQLQHPNLVQVYAVGESPASAGDVAAPYLVLEYVGGGSLAAHVNGTPQKPRAAAECLLTLARAMSHVHAQGIVHRDLKPGNILVHKATDSGPKTAEMGQKTAVSNKVKAGEEDMTPSSALPPLARSTLKITDFGLAKLGGSDLTRTGDALGTPSYMAPEQIDSSMGAIGPATDIYGLGGILYEALTGHPPFQADSPLATVLRVRHDDPVPPRRLQPTVPPDLETICLKCLRKEPRRRYASAEALADDLDRFLAGKPIQARPLSPLGRAAKWARRRPMVAALWALVAVLAAGGFIGILTQWLRAESLLTAAQNASRDAQLAQAKEADALDRQRIVRAYEEWMSDNAQAARDFLRDTAGRKETWEWRYVNRLCNIGRFAFDDHRGSISGLAYSPDGRRLFSAGRDGMVMVRDLVDGTNDRLTIPPNGPDDLSSLSVSPSDGRYLAIGAGSGIVYIWDVRARRIAANWPAHEPAWPMLVGLSPDSRYLATASGAVVKVWDLGRMLADASDPDSKSHQPPTAVTCMTAPALLIRICWSPDGRYVGGCSMGRDNVRVWEAATGAERKIKTITWQANCVTFSPDHRLFAWSGLDGVVALHDAVTFDRVATLSGLQGYQACLAFSPDGRFIAGGSASGPIKVWDIRTNQMTATLHGHSSGVRELAFSPDGTQLATAGNDRRIIVWDITNQQDVTMLRPMAAGRLYAAAFSPDSRRLVTSIREFRLFDVDLGEQVVSRPLGDSAAVGLSAAFHPAGDRFAGGNDKGGVYVFTTDGKPVASCKMKGLPLAVQFVDDGRRLLVAGCDNALCTWDLDSPEEPQVLCGPLGKSEPRLNDCQAVFAPDGRWLAYADRRQPLSIWNVRARSAHGVPDAPAFVTALASDRTGQFLAVGGDNGEIQIHNLAAGKPLAKWNGHPLAITGLSFTPDGTRLASASKDGNVKLWDPKTADEVLTLRGHATFDTTVALSPDGQVCVGGGWDGYVRVWSNKSPPNDAPETWVARRRSWHQLQAEAAERDGAWFGMVHHSSRLASLQPDDWRPHMWLGRALTELGQWTAAEVAYDAAITVPDCQLIPFYERALLYLRAGDGAAYRLLCKRMWEVQAARQDSTNRNNLVWVCAITPDPPIAPDQMVSYLERTLPETTGESRRIVLSTLGTALYRAGRFPEALVRLEESLNLATKGGIVEDWVFLALVHHRLDHVDQAREFLARANKEMEHIRATQERSAASTRLAWGQRFEAELLYKEAKTVLGD
jgi:WD40 repeat protein/serine/threonine protein kinase/Flp pilus assembly protein TadD